jgi:hypothetical protein
MGTLEALRARIAEIEGRPVRGAGLAVPRVPSGLAALDAATGGLPQPGLVEVTGPVGSGRTRLVAAMVAARTRAGERVAWVDPAAELYPPALARLGVALSRLLLVRPDAGQVDWTTEQLLRAGCFPLVVRAGGLAAGAAGRGEGARMAAAARLGASTLVLVTRQGGGQGGSQGGSQGWARPDVAVDLRVEVAGERASVARARGRVAAGSLPVPAVA